MLGGIGPARCGIISAVPFLVNVYLLDVRAAQLLRKPRAGRALVLLGCLFCFSFCALPWSLATAARVCRLALARLVLTRGILGRILGGKAIMADALHWVVAVWAGSTT